MLSAEPMAIPQAAAEVKTYLRLFAQDEDALVTACLASAAMLCERFTRQALLVRAHRERMAVTGAWTMLGAAPVQAIESVAAVAADGSESALPGGGHGVDIDAGGRGWVQVAPGAARRVLVTYRAGLAAEWDGLPDALRHGIVRLAAHLFTERGGDAAASPPAAVSALWRPWRRLALGGMASGGGDVRAG